MRSRNGRTFVSKEINQRLESREGKERITPSDGKVSYIWERHKCNYFYVKTRREWAKQFEETTNRGPTTYYTYIGGRMRMTPPQKYQNCEPVSKALVDRQGNIWAFGSP